MSTLCIHSRQVEAIKIYAAQSYPEECCGLLLGQAYGNETPKTVVELWPVENAWGDEAQATMAITMDRERQESEPNLTTEQRYWIDPKDLLAAQKAGRSRSLQIIGIYHSHPDQAAVPSECDRRWAWSAYSYVIVSVPQGKPTDVLSWVLDDAHQFQAEALEILPLP